KVKVLRAMKVCDPRNVVRGQYVGYRDEPDVSPHSQAETFAAMELEIDSWRWAGVPFLLRTGKHLKRKASEITLGFREVTYNVFRGTEVVAPPDRDHLTIRVQPEDGIQVAFNVKKPGPGDFAVDR